ncbi:hypothetical protein ACP4OV_010799 [Aristida adscensionis]
MLASLPPSSSMAFDHPSAMPWRSWYLDMILIPLALLFPAAYHLWLWHTVRRRPLRTTVGITAATRRLWVMDMIKDQERQPMVVVQSLRNVIMGSTLVATTSVILSTGVAAVMSTTYAGKKPLGDDAVLGAHGELAVVLKNGAVIVVFVLAFICQSLANFSLNQATFLVNALPVGSPGLRLRLPGVTADYVAGAMERGFMLNLAGNRLFYAGVPLLLWIFGPILSCVFSLAMVFVLYKIDIVAACCDEDGSSNGDANKKMEMDAYESIQV